MVLLLPVHGHPFGAAAQALILQFGAVGVGQGQGRVGGGGAQRIAPHRLGRRRGAAIDDQPVAADAEFEAERAGMGETVAGAGQAGRQVRRAAGGWRAAIHDHQRAAALHAMEAGILQQHRRPAAGLAVMQHQVDQRRRLLPRAVEQRQPAILVAPEAQRLAGAFQHQGKLRGGGNLGAMQQVADLDQVLHCQQVLRRAALDMAAIGEELPLQLAGQQAQRAVQPALLLQRDGGGDGRLHHHQRAAMGRLRRQAGHHGTAIMRQPGQQRFPEAVIGGGGQEVPVAKPGGDARAGDLGRLRQILARAVFKPVMRQVAPTHAGGIGPQRAQVAQPTETMCGGAPQQRAVGRRPANPGPRAHLLGCAGLERPGGAQYLQLARHQPRAACSIAGPQVLEAARRRLGHPHRLEAGYPAFRAADQVWHVVPLSAAIAAA